VGDACSQMALGGAEAPERGAHVTSEDAEVVGTTVGQSGLGQLPDMLVWIELRSVGREVFDAQPREPSKQVPDEGPSMDLDAVPEHDDGSTKVVQQRAQEGTDVGRTEVLARQALDVETAVATARAEGHGRDHRNAVMLVPVTHQRRLAPQRPGAPHRRRQEEAAFVDEDEVGAQPRGVFFTRGQSCVFHLAMAASSRSSARRSGF